MSRNKYEKIESEHEIEFLYDLEAKIVDFGLSDGKDKFNPCFLNRFKIVRKILKIHKKDLIKWRLMFFDLKQINNG